MNRLPIWHTILFTLTIFFGFIIPKSDLSKYDLEISAGLFIFFYLSKHIFIKKNLSYKKLKLLESLILTLIVLLTVNSTGKTESPFFFLIYFLLFSISLLESPHLSLLISLILIVSYIINLPTKPQFKILLPIFSLAFITPFSVYLGKQYFENEFLKRKEIFEKEDFLLFLSLKIKSSLKKIFALLEGKVTKKELSAAKKEIKHLKKLIEDYENQNF